MSEPPTTASVHMGGTRQGTQLRQIETSTATSVLAVMAWPVAMVSAVLTIAGLVLYARNAARLGSSDSLYLADAWVGMLLPVVGAQVILRGRDRTLGLALLAGALLSVTNVAGQWATYLVAMRGQRGTLTDVLAWLAAWTWTPYLILPTVVPLLFLSGRPLSRPSSALLGTTVATIVLITLGSALAPGRIDGFPSLQNPWGIPGATWIASTVQALTALTVLVLGPLCLLFAVARWRRTSGPQHTLLRWFLITAVTAQVAMVTSDALAYPWADVVLGAAFTLVLLVIALAAHSTAVLAEEGRVRAGLLRGREEERIRLHRDLHDGLGPEIAGLGLQVAATARTVEDPEVRVRLLSIQRGLHGLSTDVRALVDDLYPPELTALGLVGALHAHAVTMTGVLDVKILATGMVGALSPEMEVAAYRIICEALANTARHGGASRCEVRLCQESQALQLSVRDNGQWLAPLAERTGAGVASMQARAAELGGWLQIEPSADGTVVRARLPEQR